MKVQVKLFAILRELAGQSEMTLELPEESTALDALQTLFPDQARGEAFPASLLYAVNQAYADSSTVLQEGDELAFVPPIAGG